MTACLNVVCRNEIGWPVDDYVSDMLDNYRRLDTAAHLAVFHTRLGLCVIDAAGGAQQPAGRDVAAKLIQQTVAGRDAYAARDVLAHDGCAAQLADDQADQLVSVVKASALNCQTIPVELNVCVATAEAVLSQSLATLPPPASTGCASPDQRTRRRSGVAERPR